MTIDRTPYPGLRSFRPNEADRFFGRDDCVDSMIDRLAATHFLAVVGSSGSGKSSLVKTGLLRGLEMGLVPRAGSRWCVVTFQPGGAPLRNLAKGLLTAAGPEGQPEPSDAEVDLLRAFLSHGPRSVTEWCRNGHLPKDTNLLLLVDQFEELFRYEDYAGREEAEAFVALLIESAQSEVPIYVTLTMRSEYLGACALIEGLAERINEGMFLTPRMTRDQCREAIVGPARVCGIQIEDQLVNRLLNDLANFAPWDDRGTHDQLDRIARRADQLPLLQYTLNRMWALARAKSTDQPIVLRLADYESEEIGGLSGAINAHADEILGTESGRPGAKLGPEDWPTVEAVFRSLTYGSTVAEAVRRQTLLRDLVAVCGGNEEAVRKVVDVFRGSDCNFLTPSDDPENPKRLTPDTYIDISHESLIRQWKALSVWLAAEAEAAQNWRRLREAAEAYHARKGDLLSARELANLIEWYDQMKPNAAWAARYGDAFDLAIEFLDRSQEEHQRVAATREREKEEVAQRKAKEQQRRIVLSIVSACSVVVLMVAIWALWQRNIAQRSLGLSVAALDENIKRVRDGNQDRNVAGSVLLDILQSANAALGKLGNITDTRNIRVNILDAFSEAVGILGNHNVALRCADQEFEAAARLTNYDSRTGAYDPANDEWTHDLARSFWRIGDARLGLGDLEGPTRDPDKATSECSVEASRNAADEVKQKRLVASPPGAPRDASTAFNSFLAVTERLIAKTDSGDDASRDDWQRDLSKAYERQGDVFQSQGKFDDALALYRKKLTIAEQNEGKFADGNDPRGRNAYWKWDRALAYLNIGDVLYKQRKIDDADGARYNFERLEKVANELLGLDKNNARWQSNLASSYRRLGEIAMAKMDPKGARPYYVHYLDLVTRLTYRDPSSPNWQRTLAIAHERMGDVHLALADWERAKKSYEREREIVTELLRESPTNTIYKRDWSISVEKIGDAHLASGSGVAEALEKYREYNRLASELFKDDETNADWRRDLAISYQRIGEAHRLRNEPSPAAQAFKGCFEVLAGKAVRFLDPRNKIQAYDPASRRIENVSNVENVEQYCRKQYEQMATAADVPAQPSPRP